MSGSRSGSNGNATLDVAPCGRQIGAMTTSRIPLSGNLVLRSDPTSGWIISEVRTHASGAKAGQSYDHDLKYPVTLYNALLALREMRLVRSGSTTLEALIQTDTNFKRELSVFFEPKLEVSVPKGPRR